MALNNDAVGEQVFTALVPDGTSGSAELLAQQKRVVSALTQKIAFTVAAEDTNVIQVDLQLQSGDDTDVGEIAELELYLLDAAGLLSVVGAFTISDGGVGSLVTTDARPRCIALTDATGLLDVDITDVVAASGSTIYLVARVLNVLGVETRQALTFD